jgi:hypothetical protein
MEGLGLEWVGSEMDMGRWRRYGQDEEDRWMRVRNHDRGRTRPKVSAKQAMDGSRG